MGHHDHAGSRGTLRVHHQASVNPVTHQLHIAVPPRDISPAPADESHVSAVHRKPGSDVGARTAAVHRHRSGRVATPGKRENRVGDRIRHEITNDNDPRHIVITSSRKQVGVPASDLRLGGGNRQKPNSIRGPGIVALASSGA
jgi:hypothetical protein